MINGVVALLIGSYLLMVVWGGRQAHLYSFIKEETGFLKWAGAVITLAFLYNTLPRAQADILQQIIALAFIALLVGNGDKILKQITETVKGD